MENKVKILKTYINQITLNELINILLSEEYKDVAICNANTLVRSYKDVHLQDIINNFDIATPDGFPVVKSSNILYKSKQKRVDGYKVFTNTVREGLDLNTSHYFFGNSKEVLDKMISNLKNEYPTINISGYSSPPILDVNELINNKYMDEIIELRPDIIWLSFGFPKQEKLMSLIRSKYNLKSNLVGVGFTFEWVAGTKVKAPEFIANMGLEWVLRLIQEPRRLYKRYFVDNLLFILYFTKQYFKIKFKR